MRNRNKSKGLKTYILHFWFVWKFVVAFKMDKRADVFQPLTWAGSTVYYEGSLKTTESTTLEKSEVRTLFCRFSTFVFRWYPSTDCICCDCISSLESLMSIKYTQTPIAAYLDPGYDREFNATSSYKNINYLSSSSRCLPRVVNLKLLIKDDL